VARASTIANAEVPIPENGIIEAMYAHSSVPPGAGETYDYTLILNGAPQAMTIQIAGAVDQDGNNELNPIVVALGDLICIQCTTSLNAAISGHSASLRFRKT